MPTADKRKRGQSLVELAVGLCVGVPMILSVIDLGFIAAGAGTNDAICRDAARAAASGPPGQLLASTNRTVPAAEPPNKRARAIIKRIYQTQLPAKMHEDPLVQETLQNPLPDASTGGAIIGTVSVSTTIDVYPPFVIGAVCGANGISFSSRHACPYTYVMPAP